ncbi:MAG: hypothetical protein R3313_05200, partial [Candidatus Saccharimonadales bacterium]|nr:hypothetical protein [Candidatus Saccharimonadales bacterium]
ILVVNDEKRGIQGYIGGNVMVEMAVAYYLKKPIYILNDVPKDNPVYEEVHGLNCQVLDGRLENLKL